MLLKKTNPFSRLLSAYHSYWFDSVPFLDLEICRIIIVFSLVLNLIFGNYFDWAFNSYSLFWEDYKIGSVLAIPYLIWGVLSLNSIPNFTLFVLVFCLTFFFGISSLMQFRIKTSLTIFTIGNLAIRGYVYLFRNKPFHPDGAIMLCLVILTLTYVLIPEEKLKSNSKQRKLRILNPLSKQLTVPRFPLLLTQWMLAIIYFDSAISKLMKNPNVSLFEVGNFLRLDWLSGYSLQHYLLLPEIPLIGSWLGHNHLLSLVATWMTVIFEGAFFLVLIFPQLIKIFLPMGIAFHLGIYIAMQIPFFLILPTYAAFVPWTTLIEHYSKNSGKAAKEHKSKLVKTPSWFFHIVIIIFLLMQSGVTLRLLPIVWPFETTPMFSGVIYPGNISKRYSIFWLTDKSKIEIQPQELQHTVCQPLERSFIELNAKPQNIEQLKGCKNKLILEWRMQRDFISSEHNIIAKALIEDNKDVIDIVLEKSQEKTTDQVKGLQVVIDEFVLTKDGYKESENSEQIYNINL